MRDRMESSNLSPSERALALLILRRLNILREDIRRGLEVAGRQDEEDDSISPCIARVGLRIVGPGVRLAHNLVDCIVADASIRIIRDHVAAMTEGMLRRCTILEGIRADIRRTILRLDE